MKKAFSIAVMAVSIVLIIYSTYKSSLISNDKAIYKLENESLVVSYVNPESNVYRAGMQIGDKIIEVNGIEIFSRHVLHNMVFDRTRPAETLSYKVERGDELTEFSAVAERRFSLPELIQYLIFGIIYSFFTMLFFNSYPNTKTKHFLYSFFVCLSLLMTMFNVPFSNKILYPLMMIVSACLTLSLVHFTFYYLYEFSNRWFLMLMSVLVILSASFWMAFYFKWTGSMTESDYSTLMLFLRIFQISMALVAIYAIVSIFIKTLKLYVTNQPKEYFLSSFIFLIILILYPVLYAIPFALRTKELLPFCFFFYLFLALLLIYVFFRKRFSRVFL